MLYESEFETETTGQNCFPQRECTAHQYMVKRLAANYNTKGTNHTASDLRSDTFSGTSRVAIQPIFMQEKSS